MDVQLLETRLARRPYSPLFARIADEYLASGRIDEAKELCLSGLEKYPTYTTAHLILAKCLAAEQNFSAAVQTLDYVSIIFPDSRIVSGLRDEWNLRAHPLQPTEEPPQTYEEPQPVEHVTAIEEIAPPVIEESIPSVIEEGIAPVEEETVAIEIAPPPQPTLPSPVEYAVAQPPVQQTVTISPEELAQIERPSTTLGDEDRIVSKTLAEIYAMQGEFGEAIITYQLLKQRRPERIADFDQRINELELKMKEKIGGN